jgi:ribosomal protein L15
MKWTKPSGLEVETNDLPETIEYCKSIGWKEYKKPKPVKQRQDFDKIVGETGKLTASELESLTDPAGNG